jgi:hypothetical protein
LQLELETRGGGGNKDGGGGDDDGARESVRKQVLQSDFKNLKNVCAELEAALAEAHTPHSTRIMRRIK